MLTAFEPEHAVREAIFYKYNAKNKLFVIDWFTGFSEARGCDDDLFLVSTPPTRNKIETSTLKCFTIG